MNSLIDKWNALKSDRQRDAVVSGAIFGGCTDVRSGTLIEHYTTSLDKAAEVDRVMEAQG